MQQKLLRNHMRDTRRTQRVYSQNTEALHKSPHKIHLMLWLTCGDTHELEKKNAAGNVHFYMLLPFMSVIKEQLK